MAPPGPVEPAIIGRRPRLDRVLARRTTNGEYLHRDEEVGQWFDTCVLPGLYVVARCLGSGESEANGEAFGRYCPGPSLSLW